MAKTSNTPFTGNKLASIYHRILGRRCCFIDIDHIETETESIRDTMKEYTFENNLPCTKAFIDYKYPGESLSDQYSPIKYQIHSADNEFKIPVPFFIVIYYLDVHHKVKMFYVIPANKTARAFFDRYHKSDRGEWMSVQTYSRFQHTLRGKKWDGEEVIEAKNVLAINEAVGTVMPAGMKLKDLPDDVYYYKLPYMNFSWLSRELHAQ